MKNKLIFDRDFMIHVYRDLSRPIDPAIAAERVGFLVCKQLKSGEISPDSYIAIKDKNYLPHEAGFGAFYGKEVMDEVYKHLYNDDVIIYDIHIHDHWGVAIPSPADLWSEKRLIPSLARIRPLPHGCIILSKDYALVRQWEKTSIKMAEYKHKLKFLRELNLMEERNSRQAFLAKNLQEVLRTKKIGVIGLGGGGSLFVQSLAHLGFINYVLCDFDRVSLSNINRLVGMILKDLENKTLKVDVAIRMIKGLVEYPEIISVPHQWQVAAAEGKLDGLDIIIGCLDSFEQRRQLEIFARSKNIPYLDIGMDVKLIEGRPHVFGQVVFTKTPGPCMHCYDFFDKKAMDIEDGLYGDVNSFQVQFANQALVSEAISILMNYFTDWKGLPQESCFLEYYSNTCRWRERKPKTDSCKHF